MLVTERGDDNVFSQSLVFKNRGGKRVAELGLVASSLLQRFDLSQQVFFADIDWSALMKVARRKEVEFREISKFPAVSRDLALLIDKQVEFQSIETLAMQTEKKLLKRVELFDVYEGKNLPEGKKSYAVNFILQDENATLKDQQIEAIMQKLIRALKEKLGAELR